MDMRMSRNDILRLLKIVPEVRLYCFWQPLSKPLFCGHAGQRGRPSLPRRRESVTDVADTLDKTIKWTRAVKKDVVAGRRYKLDSEAIQFSYYRPFVKWLLYFNKQLNEMVYQVPQIFGAECGSNLAFAFSAEERSEFGAIAFDVIPNKDIFMPSAAQVLARYRYANGTRLDNITDWALEQFRVHYEKGKKSKRAIDKDAIFHYTYSVLLDPVYREKYALNLKREFPRIPFYADF
jgi:predicted helicase